MFILKDDYDARACIEIMKSNCEDQLKYKMPISHKLSNDERPEFLIIMSLR